VYPLLVLIRALTLLTVFAPGDPRTPNELFQDGSPTFVVGTRGDDRPDRLIRTQADYIRDQIFSEASIFDDTELHEDSAEWPERLLTIHEESLLD
jgi:hypothetical protein